MSNRRPDSSYNLCTYQFANRKCCGMPANPSYHKLSLNHGAIHRRTHHREDDLLAELASPAGDFITQFDIKYVLGKLFQALAANRVSPPPSPTLATFSSNRKEAFPKKPFIGTSTPTPSAN
jgi:hypothetical protein